MTTQTAAPTTSEPAAVRAAKLLSQADALLSRAFGRGLAEHGLNWPQAMSLFVLAEQSETISATRLVEQLGLGRTAMTSVVDRLERQGWVERRRSATDRRVADLVLTDSGRKLVEEVRPVVQRLAERLFSGINTRDLNTSQNSLDRLLNSLRRDPLVNDGVREP